jgi:hypothetical protein
LLLSANVRKELLVENGLQFIRRTNNEGQVYFINNRSNKTFSEWIPLNSKASSVALFDPMFGKNGLAHWRNAGKGIEVYIQLQPFESVIIQTYKTRRAGNQYSYPQSYGEKKEISGEWNIEFLSGGPVLPKNILTNKLNSWTEYEDTSLKNFSGTAKYSINFQKPSAPATSWLLDLGKVNETAEVFLNGKKLATLIGPSYQIIVPSSNLKTTNRLEIIVANLMANRIAYMDRNNMPWKVFYNIYMPARKKENAKNGIFDASNWKLLPSGLLGPVTLAAVKNFAP